MQRDGKKNQINYFVPIIQSLIRHLEKVLFLNLLKIDDGNKVKKSGCIFLGNHHHPMSFPQMHINL